MRLTDRGWIVLWILAVIAAILFVAWSDATYLGPPIPLDKEF